MYIIKINHRPTHHPNNITSNYLEIKADPQNQLQPQQIEYKDIKFIDIKQHICQVTCIWQVTPAFLYFCPHSKFSPAFTCILLILPTITHILFDGNKIAQVNLFARRKEKYWSHLYPNLIKSVMCG